MNIRQLKFNFRSCVESVEYTTECFHKHCCFKTPLFTCKKTIIEGIHNKLMRRFPEWCEWTNKSMQFGKCLKSVVVGFGKPHFGRALWEAHHQPQLTLWIIHCPAAGRYTICSKKRHSIYTGRQMWFAGRMGTHLTTGKGSLCS